MPNIDIPMGDKKISQLATGRDTETGSALRATFPSRGVQLRSPNVLESIADPTTWDVTVGTGTVTTSSTNTLLITSATGTAQSVRRVTGLSLPFGGALVVRMKRDANLSVLDIMVRTAAYTSPRVYSANLGVNPMPAGEWYDLVFLLAAAGNAPVGSLSTDGDRITGLEIKVTPSAGNVTVLEIESVRVAEGNPAPGVCFQFDDGRIDTYTTSYPILKAAGIRGSIAIEHTAVGNTDRCSQAQYDEMYTNGWAYLGHHTVQMTTLDAASQNLVHQASKDYLMSKGYTRGANHWVWPGGARSIASDKIARKYWRTRRAVSPMIANAASVGTTDPYDPNVYYITQSSTVDQMKIRVDNVQRNGGVLVLVFHSIVPTMVAPEDWSIANFQALVDYVASLGIKTYTYDEVFDPRRPERIS